MGCPSYGARKNKRREGRVLLKGLKRTCGMLFLDSGAHSLYHEHTLGKPRAQRYDWYVNSSGDLSLEYCRYLDQYAEFVFKYRKAIDCCVTVDAIYNPEISYKAHVYLESHGLRLLPVIHHRTPLKWVDKYLDRGYDYIGVGGLGQESSRASYTEWADKFFTKICPGPSHLPIVKTHGFAMVSYALMLRYPWYSVDSASWAKAAGYGTILVPHKRLGKFDFAHMPYVISTSAASPAAKTTRHYLSLSPAEQRVVCEWLDLIGVPLGAVDKEGKTVEYGVLSEYNARAVACCHFYDRLAKWLPEWPWAFRAGKRRNSFF